MIEIREQYLDPDRIMKSGQLFRMYRRDDSADGKAVYELYSGQRRLRIEQEPGSDKLYFDCSQEEFDSWWKSYFDLDRDYSILVSSIDREDLFLAAAAEFGSGIRVLRQDIWEMMISFIISQQKQIPSIRKCIEALCRKYGSFYRPDGEQEGWYGFPSPEAIAAGGTQGLEGLSLGYRARYIYETAVQYLDHGLTDSRLMSMSYEDAKKYLCSFTGIGEKVANCILLFGAGFTDAFPIDVHIKDILYREYYLKDAGEGALPEEALKLKDFEELIDRHFGLYKGSRGIMQQWVFAYELNVMARADRK